VVAAATLAAPAAGLTERLAALHRAVPMTGARLHGEVWHPGSPPEPLIVDGEPLAAQDLVERFDLTTQPPFRVVVGAGGRRLAVACHHAAFDGLGLLGLLTALVGGPEPRAPGLRRDAGLPWALGPRRAPELRGLVGRLVRPADRVAPSRRRAPREALAVREVALAGPGVTARLVDAAVAAAGARNHRLGRPWRRVGVNIGLAGPGDENAATAGLAGPHGEGAAGIAGGAATVSLRARDLSSEDAEALLADLVAPLEAGP
jgi:hypothetical protein